MAGNDFVFALEGASSPEGPWNYLHVVRLIGEEAMSRLFRYEVVVLLKGDDADPDTFVGKRATLRIATLSEPFFRLVHGVITEAEDAGLDQHGPIYRLVIEPPLIRAKYRKRNRIFLDKTLRRIIETVLQTDTGMTLVSGALLDPPVGSPAYQPASERFTWRISQSPRLDDPKARAYVVQYGESDLDFISRLLEEEGISYHFEHGDDVSLLVLSDKDGGRPRIPFDDTFAPGKPGRAVGQFGLGGRLRPTSVHLGEYNWEKPALDINVKWKGSDSLNLGVYAFPGGHVDSAELGKPLAEAIVDALHTEASFAHGAGTTRLLSAGTTFCLEHSKSRYTGEYLVTRLLCRGYQQGVLAVEAAGVPNEPFHVEFDCACRGRGSDVAESRFRPQRVTPKPRIFGTQTAFVTAEPNASGEINIGGPGTLGCVRVAFHWDTDKQRLTKEGSSKWIRVSEPFARGGQGGIWHPRVGTEVIVEYEEGDPDRPVVTGRVYNGKNRPTQTTPTHSTMWSLSTPGGAVRNEITFEDTAGSERIYMNAGKDMTTNVGNDRRENVGVNAFMHVGADNTEEVALNQTIEIGTDDTLDVGGDQCETIGSNQLRIIAANRIMLIGGNETRKTGANHGNFVGASLTELIGGNVDETYGAIRSTTMAANWTELYGATRTQTVSALCFQGYGGNQITTVGAHRFIQVGAVLGELVGGTIDTTIGGTDTLTAGAAIIHVAGGGFVHTAPSLTINAPLKVHLTGVSVSVFPLEFTMTGLSASVTGTSIALKGVNTSADGATISLTGADISSSGGELWSNGSRFAAIGILVYPAGMHVRT